MKKLAIVSALIVLSILAKADKVYIDSLVLTKSNGEDTVEIYKYDTGTVIIPGGMAKIKVPKGFKYLDQQQARYVLETVWENPPSYDVLGLLLPIDRNPYESECWAISISYDESGHVNDDDAKDVNYDDLLEEMQGDIAEENKTRQAQGYQTLSLIGWAVTPFYDEKNHKLHWAKEILFTGDSASTLNYNIRILGKEGFLVMNAIAGMNQLAEVNNNLENVLASVEFNDGFRYDQFDESIHKVAAYGIGGLVAGKVLAKAGFFAIILKFWKIIAMAVVGGFIALRKKIFGS